MGKKVPEVLLSGHHKNIEEWRYEQSMQRTQERRPDLYEIYVEAHREELEKRRRKKEEKERKRKIWEAMQKSRKLPSEREAEKWKKIEQKREAERIAKLIQQLMSLDDL